MSDAENPRTVINTVPGAVTRSELRAKLEERDEEVRELRRELESALERNQPNADAVKEYQSQVLRLQWAIEGINRITQDHSATVERRLSEIIGTIESLKAPVANGSET